MASSRYHGALSHPLSVEEITKQAEEFDFSPSRPLQSLLRAARLLLTEAKSCEHDGNLQLAYLYLYRHANLVIGRLPQHPDYRDPKYRSELAQAQATVQKNLALLEEWKPKIKQDYQRYTAALERRAAEKQRLQNERQAQQSHLDARDVSSAEYEPEDVATFDATVHAVDAKEHRQLAVDLAHREIRRRQATRQTTRQAGIPPDTVVSRRQGMIVDAHNHGADDRGAISSDHNSISDNIVAAGRYLPRRSGETLPRRKTQPRTTTSIPYSYPSVPEKEDAVDWRSVERQPTPKFAASCDLPSRPPKNIEDNRRSRESQAPSLPPKANNAELPSPPRRTSIPQPEQTQVLPKYTFQPTASTEAGTPLRTLLLPPTLRQTFLNLAHPNTALNLETCGILCGTLISNALFINHLIIPDQHSTSDTCDTTESGDNALFDYCDGHDLLVCGWIHTHPSQTCFLSSRDLHTSAGYQVMLPEAIAIVCAPRQNPDWGIFRLTDPPGLKHVLGCEQRGLFHPHSESNLYTDALRPGHVVEGPGLEFEVVDLRKR